MPEAAAADSPSVIHLVSVVSSLTSLLIPSEHRPHLQKTHISRVLEQPTVKPEAKRQIVWLPGTSANRGQLGYLE